jgi:hypothetical protein
MLQQLDEIELELQVGVAKVSKYATRESGDTLELTERPHGGLSLVLADGQRSGRAAKIISALVARKAIALLGEGVRDGAAARATHDYLRTHRQGQVSAELSIVSLDLMTRTVVISRNTHCPVFILSQEGLQVWNEPSEPIGIHAGIKPVITELPVVANTWVVVFTDGVLEAGQRFGASFDITTWITTHLCRAPVPLRHSAKSAERSSGDAGSLAAACRGERPERGCSPAKGAGWSTDSDSGERGAQQWRAQGGVSGRGIEYRGPGEQDAEALANAILAHAIELDKNRPQDDMSVLVLALLPLQSTDHARRLTVRFPVPPI